MLHQYRQNVRTSSFCYNASGANLDADMSRGHTDLDDLRGHTSGSADGEFDGSADLASRSVDTGYGGSADSVGYSNMTRDSSYGGLDRSADAECSETYSLVFGSADKVATNSNDLHPDRSVDRGCGDLAFSFGAGSADEEQPKHDAINVQAESRERRKALSLDDIMVQLQRTREERNRELCETLFLPELEGLPQEAQLKEILKEVNREVGLMRSPSQVGMPAVLRAMAAELGGAEPAWTPAPSDADGVRRLRERQLQGHRQSQAGPVLIGCKIDAPAVTGQRAKPSQWSAQTPPTGGHSVPRARALPETTPGPLPSAASVTSQAGAEGFLQMLEEVGGETRDVNRASLSLPKRKRTLRPLPSWARTLIVRNVPWSYTQEGLLLPWPPDGTYNYFHVPYHFFNDRPFGHVYINFVTYEAAAAFHERWHGRYLSPQDNKNTLDITVANIQGRGPNLARIAPDKIPALAENQFLPVLLDGTRRLDTREVIAEMSRSYTLIENESSAAAYQ